MHVVTTAALQQARPYFEALDNSFTTSLADVEQCCAMVRSQHCKYLNEPNSHPTTFLKGTILITLALTLTGKYLNDESLPSKSWLLHAEGVRTRGGDTSESSLMHSFFRELWAKTKAKQAKGEWLGSPWTADFVSMLDESMVASEPTWSSCI